MSYRPRFRPFLAVAAASWLLAGGVAHADEASVDTAGAREAQSKWGFGARVRQQRLSKRIQKFFLGDTPGPINREGAGIELTRLRHDDIEFVLGMGYDRLDGNDGYYLEGGGDPTAPGDVEYWEFRDLSWFTVEANIVGNLPLHKILALRYGVGLGVGLVRGEILASDAVCTGGDLENDCEIDPNAEEIDRPEDVPPVLPVVNALVGLQLRPFEALAINIDAGLHTVPYIGGGVTLYLW